MAPGVHQGFIVASSEAATVEGPGRSSYSGTTSHSFSRHRIDDHRHHDGELAAPRRVLVAGRDLSEPHLRVGGREFLHLVPEVFAAVLVLIPDPSGDVVPGRDGVRLLEMQAVRLLLYKII